MLRHLSPRRSRHPRLRVVLLICLAVLLSLPASVLAGRANAAPPPESGSCADPLPIACGWSVTGNTSGGPNNISSYCGSGLDESGPEHIYAFDLPAGTNYDVTARLDKIMVDLDVVLLSDCATGVCLPPTGIGDTEVSSPGVAPGSYYIAVDGYKGAEGGYELELECTPLDIQDLVVTTSVDDAKAHDDNPGDGICRDMGGQCSLRAAVEESNVLFGLQRISFASSMVIALDSAMGDLPTFIAPITVDASSVWDFELDRPGVTIEGGGDISNGLRLDGGSSQVYGLYITGMTLSAVRITSGINTVGGTGAGQRNVLSDNDRGVSISYSGSDGNEIQSNYIGVDPSGLVAQPNRFGVLVANGASWNMIGGTTAERGNVISGNSSDGIYINHDSTHHNMVSANLIGPVSDGSTVLGNGQSGVRVTGGAYDSVIGRSDWYRNIIAGNGDHGVDFFYAGDDHFVGSNLIFWNGGSGVELTSTSHVTVAQNRIHSNGEAGVRMVDGASDANTIIENSITYNDGKGIDLAPGANDNIAAPIILAASESFVSGTTSPGWIVEVFSDSADEGRVYHDTVVADSAGDWIVNADLDGPYITATVRDRNENSSEFSAPWALTLPSIPRSYLPLLTRS